jgi:hypothetical protein
MEIYADYTEAEVLADIEECRDDHGDQYGYDNESYQDFKDSVEKSIKSDYDRYLINKKAKVGTLIICAENRCKKKFIKKSYQQAFCCIKHKDKFWNRQRLFD